MRHEYGSILIRVEDMMKRSFSEIDSARHKSDHQKVQRFLKESIESIREDCPICIHDIDQYYSACLTIANSRKRMQVSDAVMMLYLDLKMRTSSYIIIGNVAKESSSSQSSMPGTDSCNSYQLLELFNGYYPSTAYKEGNKDFYCVNFVQ